MKTIVTTLALLFSLCLAHAQKTYTPDWASIDSRPVPEWFVDAKFGIFIHWGLYAVPAWGPTDGAVYDKYAEWYWWKLLDKNNPVNSQFVNFHNTTFGPGFKYQDFVNGFKCEMFEPTDWAKLFRDAGARYVVLTSKHHEGFTLWPSTHAWNWNAVDVGPHRDLAGDLIQAVRAEGLRMGYYYSLYEWFNPLYRSDVSKYVDQHMIPQMKDLVNRYKPDIVWTDGEWDHPSEVWKSTEFLAWLYNESPVRDDVVVNDRWGKETRSVHGGIYTTEYDLVHEGVMTGVMEHPWEECRGIGGSFGYNRNENLSDYSTSGATGAYPHRQGGARRQPAAQHRPDCRRADTRNHAAAAEGHGRLARRERRGDLRHPQVGKRAGSREG
jgi:alpha-L-fucosidase